MKQGRRCAKDTVIPEEALGVKTALGELSDMNDKIESGLNRIERGIGEEEGEFDPGCRPRPRETAFLPR